MARLEWVEERLQNWARWRIGRSDGDLGPARSEPTLWSGAGRGRYATPAVPILEAEAAATDEAVNRLTPAGMVLTVHLYYCGRGGHEEKAKELCCAVSTMYARIDSAHQQLAEHFRAQQERQRIERARVEALQRKSFPR